MKPSKKQNIKPDTMKNQLGEEKAVQKINLFFQTAPKSFNIQTEVKNTSSESSKKYYVEALKKKLQVLEGAIENESGAVPMEDGADGAYAVNPGEKLIEVHGNDENIAQDVNVSQDVIACAGCVKKTEEFKDLETKHKELKNRYLKLTIRHSELDLKYQDLIKTGTRTGQPDGENQVIFSDDIFSANEIRALKSLSLDKSKDSTFVLQCLKYAYKGDLAVMCSKSLNGKQESLVVSEEGDVNEVAGKDPLTPQKVERIKQLFIERLSACSIDSVSYGERIKESKINQLFATGIKNIAKKFKQ